MLNFQELSEREKQVLVLIAQGLSNKEIADELQISHFTVYSHVAHILQRLKVKNRLEAAALYWAQAKKE